MKNLCVIVALILAVMLGGCGSQLRIAQSDNASKTSSPSSNAAISSDAIAKSSPSSQPNSVISQEKAAGIITDFLLKKGISKAADPNLVIVLDHSDTADGKEYYVFHVYDNMSDHSATIGWYGVQKNDGSLYDFVLMKPTANVPGSPSITPEGTAAGKVIGPASLLIGTWVNAEQQLQVNFSRYGYCTVKNNGAFIGRSTYSIGIAGNNSISITIEGTSTKIVFTDENHMQRNDVSYVRVSEKEMVNSVTTLKKLLIGAWQSTDSCLVFDANGTLTVKQVGNPDMVSTFTIEGLDKTSMTITFKDPAGTISSKVASFTGNDTLVIGEADYTRVS